MNYLSCCQGKIALEHSIIKGQQMRTAARDGGGHDAAAWALVTGILQLAAAIEHRGQIPGMWMQGLSGVLSIVLGLLLAGEPVIGILSMIWVLGVYAIVFGISMIGLGISMRRGGSEVGQSQQTQQRAA